ncbi:glycosyltransferase family 4 protein [Lachnospiraceae bacterium NSJ-143]|nr:glycosyltransferase family 4 protein [Lachnospiraceae bacterium NSJ-143]
MKIAFESQLLLDENKTGIGWLAYNTIYSMKRLRSDNSYSMNFFLLSKKKEKHLRLIESYKNEGFNTKCCNWFNYVIYKLLWNFIPINYSCFFGKSDDVTIFFNYYIPPGVKGKKLTFVHDMTYKAFPETVNKRTLYMLNMNMKKSCLRADKILTISEFSKSEIVKYMNIDAKKIDVVPVGVNHDKFKVCSDKNKIQKVLDKYNIDCSYFLYLGTLEPRKNIEGMIDAYLAFKKKNKNAPKFVLAGRKGWLYESIFERVKQYGIEDSVIFTGYVEEHEAPLLLNGALAFLFVSLYEGFGMPPLEAMACGTPVITSKVSSLPEVVGNIALLVNPYSPEEITEAMEKIYNDKELRSSLSQKGLKRAEEFTWDKSAKAIFSAIDSL